MVRKAHEWMEQHGFDFIITGEVIGQRPMSQRKATMPIIAEESGAHDRLLRPLCAKLLPPTMAEREGWVDREQLGEFSGRNRKPQIAMARGFGFDDFAQPAGGCCFLTDEKYSVKLADLWATRGNREYDLDDIMLLKVGRHLRPRPHFKMIIAREEGEGRFLRGYRNRFTHLQTMSHGGPLVLLDGATSDDDVTLAARIAARYSQGRDAELVTVEVQWPDGRQTQVEVAPLPSDDIPQEWHV